MSDGVEDQGSPEVEASTEGVEYSPAEQVTDTAPQNTSNPFWKEVEDKLGPNNYAVIQPYLAKADAEYHKGITSANERLKPYQEFQSFIDRGLSPQALDAAVNFAVQVRDQPEVIFEHLRNFLAENGRLPSTEELKQEIAEGENGEEPDPRDAQLQKLMGDQEQLRSFILQREQQQAQQRANAEADNWVSGELERIQTANPDFSKEDVQEILRIAAFQAQQSGQVVDNFDGAVAQYVALRDRLRTTPRPGALAPSVPNGLGGGTPGTGTVDPSKMSSADRQALVAQMLGNR